MKQKTPPHFEVQRGLPVGLEGREAEKRRKASDSWLIFISTQYTKTLSYIFVDRFLCGLYNEVSKRIDPFVR